MIARGPQTKQARNGRGNVHFLLVTTQSQESSQNSNKGKGKANALGGDARKRNEKHDDHSRRGTKWELTRKISRGTDTPSRPNIGKNRKNKDQFSKKKKNPNGLANGKKGPVSPKQPSGTAKMIQISKRKGRTRWVIPRAER